ncbi:MAG: myo-inosose-2 dehydratase [Myxococcota bacterium]
MGSESFGGTVSRIGISPILWSNDDLPVLGADVSLDRCLAEARKAGFEGIELGHKFPKDPPSLKRLLSQHALHLVAGWFGSRLLARNVDDEMNRLAPTLDLLAEVDCHLLVLAEMTGAVHRDRTVSASKRPLLHPEGFKLFGESLTLLADALFARGFEVAYHHHVGTVIETMDDLDALMDHTGETVKLTLDTGHAQYGGFDPADVLRRHRGRVSHLHLKDIRPGTLRNVESHSASFLDAVVDGVFTVPGDGAYDFKRFFDVLQEEPYDGWLVVEADQDPDRADPFVYASIGRNSLRRWLGI